MKKIDMKVSKRDKNLLIFLITFIIGFLCLNYAIFPALSENSNLKAQEYAANEELKNIQDIINKQASLENQEKQLKQKLSLKYQIFFYELNQERILYKLDTLIQQSGLSVKSYTPADKIVSSISVPQSKYTYTKYPLLNYAIETNSTLLDSFDKGQVTANKTGSSSSSTLTESSIAQMSITINFNNTSYSSIMGFIKKIEDMNKAIIIDEIDIHKGETNLSGRIVITIYSMPKVDENESNELIFSPTTSKGKADPFH